MQEFFINQNSLNPLLEMEIIDDGRYDFNNSLIDFALQDSIISFSMKNIETDQFKIINAPAEIFLIGSCDCGEKYALRYIWKERDVKEKGIFQGFFNIKFNGDIQKENTTFPKGNLIVPIQDDLIIYIK